MTENAYIFVWDSNGLENIIPITQFESVDKDNTMRMLKGQDKVRNPLDGIMRRIYLRATLNSHREYHAYAIDCSPEMDEKFWLRMWRDDPEACKTIITEKGEQIF